MAKTTHRFGDDDTEFDEQVAEESARLMDRLESQFNRLQLKAQEIGVSSVVILHAHDPLNGYSFRRHKRVGDHYANLGAVEITRDLLRKQLSPDN